MHARGADVSIDTQRISITRSPLGASLWQDETIAVEDLLGWNRQAPDGTSPGFIELLVGKDGLFTDATTLNFSPADEQDFVDIDRALTNVQAGYPLEAGAGESGAASDNNPASSDKPKQQAQSSTISDADWVTEAGQGQLAFDIDGGADEEAVQGSGKSGGAKRGPAPWAAVATPDEVPETNEQADIDNPVYGQVVCVTGDVEPYDKGQIWDMIAGAGGEVGKNVTKKTTMLIIGEWATTTSKEKRARELIGKGQEIQLVPLKEFLTMVGAE
ncbi:BRCT domain-containing protein [Corynebacterium auriscanis]|uniref:BRCT domain-containing protein n=1 Tax=Corynebacterium auriscanis TaxID=99807 RepID=UPI003CEF1C07